MNVVLWRSLKRIEQRDLSRRFMAFAPDAINIISVEEFYLFCQWLLGKQYGYLANGVVECAGGMEFEFERPEGKPEILQVYPGTSVAYGSLYTLLETHEGRSYQKIRVYMRANETAAMRKLKTEFPILLEILDGDGLRRRLGDEQRRYKPKPIKQPSFLQNLKSKIGLG